jgi:NAD(P)-dependent dehydrogenase (short-subunit alcohol dehydrogenase family)
MAADAISRGGGLFDLTGKVALVTGATRGIGKAIASAFLEAGARVAISSEDAAACAAVEREFRDAGAEAVGIAADVASLGEITRLVEEATRRYGALDIVVGNAGIAGRPGKTSAIESHDHERVMAINLTANISLAACAAPHLKARGGGSLIFISSISALRGNGAISSYALSKAALAQLARNLAVELGPYNIRANTIAPGLIRTELSRDLIGDETFMARRMQLTPLRRPGEVWEVAGTALYLASTAGAFVTGQMLVVDGGTVITDGS